ncbi:MAG: spore coat protein CotJC [Hungatella sp.]|jgi:spore coat protein JC|nr:spore coat protein CotJC [Hungatella sp.]
MWNYEKRLQYPVNISQSNPKIAQFIMSQYGGPDGEMGASMRYLSQRYAMPYDVPKAVLTDIGISVSQLPPSHSDGFFPLYLQ